jgi:two-component system sensor histidine kinase KdpD
LFPLFNNIEVSNRLSHLSGNPKQYTIAVLAILSVALGCSLFPHLFHYKVVALLLLVTVSILAMLFDIVPVLISALLSALVWDFFFIPPRFTFTVSNTEDALMLSMYFIIALVNAVLTYKIRQTEKEASRKKEEEHALKLYDTLLNSLSHELRTPIAAIIGATDNLQTQNNKLSPEHKDELLSEISKASLRLNTQVENLLNMSRLESGVIRPKKDWCDINELIHNVVNRISANFENRAIEVIVKENLPFFKIDHGLIEQILYNLIHNSALYIPKYSVIKVRANCLNEQLNLVVEDNGNGFPEDEIDRVFEKFYRLRNTNTGGTGLGLSIVKGFVEAQRGTIKLDNMEGGGARFVITIPAETSYINNLKNE